MFFLMFFLFATSCKTSKIMPPEERYDTRFEEKKSLINIPVRINMLELEKSLNRQLSGVIYEDNDINDGDDMMVKAEKRSDIKLSVNGRQINYRTPLNLWIKYDLGLTTVEATGALALNFKTSFDIRNDWTVETQTDIEGYEWLEKPKLRVIGMNLPIGFIADMILKNSKSKLTKSIDKLTKDNLDLRKMVEDAWKRFFDPVLVAPEYNTWLTLNPESIGMTPLTTINNELVSTIVVESMPKVKIGDRPEVGSPKSLPPLRYVDKAQEDFVIHIKADVSFREAERIAQTALVGETFTQGRRAVKIEDVKLYGQGNNLVVTTKLSGSYEGNVYLIGKPVFNLKTNKIDLDNLDFSLETKSFLVKSGAWILKSTLRKKLQENLDFLLDYNLKGIQEKLQQQLTHFSLTSGAYLTGQLQVLNIENVYLTQDAIIVDLGLQGRVNVVVNGLN